ncbi:MAG TPA: hypothetical protein VMM76_10805 [Pirellulaceae bacterium]|nr:hypothetical protein [Pirellulaceae bacterium]
MPSNAVPISPAPADRRPQLDPIPQRSGGGGSASRVLPPDTEVFVRTLEGSDALLELTPPLLAPGLPGARTDINDDFQDAPELLEVNPVPAESAGAKSLALLPVSWSIPAPSYDRKLPTNKVWDDTGWRSEQ